MLRTVLFALSLAGLLWNCSGKRSQGEETQDSLAYADSVQKNSSSTLPEGTGQPYSSVLVGSDENVDHSGLDTVYYTILKYQPIAGDFYSLKSITNHVVDLDSGESGERFVVHLVTSELLEKVETGMMLGSMSYRTEYLLHNYLYLIEFQNGPTLILSHYNLGDCHETSSDIGALTDGNYYFVNPVEIKTQQFAISSTHLDEPINLLGENNDQRGQASVYLLRNNTFLSVLNIPYQITKKETGVPDTDSYSFVTNYNFEFIPLDSINNGLPDIGFKEHFEERRGRYPNFTTIQTARITPCHWTGEAYDCSGTSYIVK